MFRLQEELANYVIFNRFYCKNMDCDVYHEEVIKTFFYLFLTGHFQRNDKTITPMY